MSNGGYGETKNYRDLVVWQKAVDLVTSVYETSRWWPKEEQYGLTMQVRRAVVSVPSNIAEGQGRSSTKEFLHHLSIARGSLLEVETQMIVAQRLGFLPHENLDTLLENTSEVGRLLNGLFRSL